MRQRVKKFWMSFFHVECSWKGEACQLKVHYEEGFTLTELPSKSGTEGDGKSPRVLWHYGYTQLRTSADDGNRLLWLDFGAEDGEKVLHHYVNAPTLSFLTTTTSC
jgi:hypothetical protein